MYSLHETIWALCDNAGISVGKMCSDTGISRGNLTDLKMGRIKSLSATNLQKIADYFKVPVDYLLSGESFENDELPALTKKDERDIAKRLDTMVSQLGGDHDGLMFDGEPLDDETRELLVESLRKDLEWAKRMAKKKYTPKKYRKPTE